uniref:Uncharacterized protein n=1 Tax=viral metagenome TaxID=1070528 RepID=A0A6M3XZT6_9ZZZZ
MKMRGSAVIHLECLDLECTATSPFFRAYLFEEDGEVYWEAKKWPAGWDAPEDSELYVEGNMVLGFCPKHREQVLNGDKR